jgi:hypothetical protein
LSDDALSEAVILYLGYGDQAYPQRAGGRVNARFGLLRGAQLVSRAKRLDRIVGKTPVDWAVDDLPTATDRARRRATEAAPGLSGEALDALAWAFSYDWK